MKKSCLTAVALLTLMLLQAQERTFNFFERNGSISNARELSEDMSYTLAHLDHRADDVVWAHVVYSIIDLRDTRNLQTAFPTDQDVQFKNLFRLMTDAVAAGAPVYYANEAGISPYFSASNKVAKDKLSDVFFIETNVAGAQYIDPLFTYDAASGTLAVSNRIYDRFSRRITKFMLQKVYYFDKHLSRFHTRIVGIAPVVTEPELAQSSFMNDDEEPGNGDARELKTTLRESVLCWFLYDELKPQLAGQLIYQISNSAQRMSYDEYFTKKMYSDYLIGDNNLFKRLYSTTEEISIPQLKASVQQLANELIEVESGVWTY
jgi:gliding motility associated protien GldN